MVRNLDGFKSPEEKLGYITDIIYYNEENGYTIAVVETDDEQFTSVGYLPGAKVGRRFRFFGEWKVHPNYGEQFAFKDIKEEMPETDRGIEMFLGSGAIKGVGKRVAATIVDKFGEDTFRIIEEEPFRLTEVNGIGKKKAEDICQSFREHKEFAEVTLYFSQYGISAKAAMKLYAEYGSATIDIISEDPYVMVNDIFGVGFKTADKIAAKMGADPNSEARIQSGIKYILWNYINDGSTYIPRKLLVEHALALLDVPSEEIEENIDQLALESEIRISELDGVQACFLSSYYNAERTICLELKRLEDSNLKTITGEFENLIKATEAETGIEFSTQQKNAIIQSFNHGIFVITGGPGTGKTTTINSIMDIFNYCGFKTAIAAPTGRAAKRITETSGYEASTIHRLLEYYYSENKDEMEFGRNKNNPLELDAIVIDEASMVDVNLMKSLLEAIPDGTRLIMVGDADQLPPVGAGNVLRDMLESEVIPSDRLTEIFRQAQESLIVVNAHRINRGEYPYYNEEGKDFFLLKRSGEKKILSSIIELCTHRLPKFYGDFDPTRDVQILTPVKKGMLGTYNLNKELQNVLNPPAQTLAEKKIGDSIFRVNDKVMQMKNNYDLKWKDSRDFSEGEGVFNGDIGYINSIDLEFNVMTVVYDGSKYVEYDMNGLDELETAYAVTVHKSQGSEFPVVIMPISYFPPALATRNLIYTAVTRGRDDVILVGSEDRLNAMVDNDQIRERYSALKNWLIEFLSEDISGANMIFENMSFDYD
jgi:exodeoxyribonuclease V alpha subunit